MTVEEAIEILNKGYTPRGERESFKRYFLARGMAIRSLEAWEKVIKEINESFINNDLDFGEETHYNSALVDVLEIIDKHLSEVSE